MYVSEKIMICEEFQCTYTYGKLSLLEINTEYLELVSKGGFVLRWVTAQQRYLRWGTPWRAVVRMQPRRRWRTRKDSPGSPGRCTPSSRQQSLTGSSHPWNPHSLHQTCLCSGWAAQREKQLTGWTDESRWGPQEKLQCGVIECFRGAGAPLLCKYCRDPPTEWPREGTPRPV